MTEYTYNPMYLIHTYNLPDVIGHSVSDVNPDSDIFTYTCVLCRQVVVRCDNKPLNKLPWNLIWEEHTCYSEAHDLTNK